MRHCILVVQNVFPFLKNSEWLWEHKLEIFGCEVQQKIWVEVELGHGVWVKPSFRKGLLYACLDDIWKHPVERKREMSKS